MKTATTERPLAGQFPLRIALALVAARGVTEIDRVTDDEDVTRMCGWKRCDRLRRLRYA